MAGCAAWMACVIVGAVALDAVAVGAGIWPGTGVAHAASAQGTAKTRPHMPRRSRKSKQALPKASARIVECWLGVGDVHDGDTLKLQVWQIWNDCNTWTGSPDNVKQDPSVPFVTRDRSSPSIRMVHIDSCELGQTRQVANRSLDCGMEAQTALSRMAHGQQLLCLIEGKDVYQRALGTCFHRDDPDTLPAFTRDTGDAIGASVGDVPSIAFCLDQIRCGAWRNVNLAMVEEGQALVYRSKGPVNYLNAQRQAREREVGLWSGGQFDTPWAWRRLRKGRTRSDG